MKDRQKKYRKSLSKQGMTQIQIWVPDTEVDRFKLLAAEARLQLKKQQLNNS